MHTVIIISCIFIFIMFFSGQLRIPSKISILHVEQEVNGDDTMVLDSVLECDEERRDLMAAEKKIQSDLSDAKNAK